VQYPRTNSADRTDNVHRRSRFITITRHRIADIDGARVQRVAKKRSERNANRRSTLTRSSGNRHRCDSSPNPQLRNPRHWLLSLDEGRRIGRGTRRQIPATRVNDATLIHSGDKYAYQSSDNRASLFRRPQNRPRHTRRLLKAATASTPACEIIVVIVASSIPFQVSDLRSIRRGGAVSRTSINRRLASANHSRYGCLLGLLPVTCLSSQRGLRPRREGSAE